MSNEGGTSFGRGTYGAVYGNPAPLCKNDKNKNKNKEVGKVFILEKNTQEEAEENANKEYHIHYELKTAMTPKDFLQFQSQYAVLPKQLCEIDKTQMEKQSQIYTPEWKETNDGEQLDEIDDASKMILYDKAEMDMQDHLTQKMNSFHDLQDECKNLQNIFHAIQLLHYYNIVHFDLKTSNIVFIHNKYKLIDFGKYKRMDANPSKLSRHATHIGYFAYPSSTLYFLYDQPNKLSATDICNESNTKSFLNLHHFLYEPFQQPQQNPNLGFTQKQQEQLQYYCRELYGQKFFGFMGFYEQQNNNNKPDKTQTITDYKKYLETRIQQNTLFPQNLNPKPTEQIQEIYRKIDIYALGIILLSILKEFMKKIANNHDNNKNNETTNITSINNTTTKTTRTKNNKTRKIKTTKKQQLTEKERRYIMQLYELAFQCCNYIQPPTKTTTTNNNKSRSKNSKSNSKQKSLYFASIETLTQKLKQITTK